MILWRIFLIKFLKTFGPARQPSPSLVRVRPRTLLKKTWMGDSTFLSQARRCNELYAAGSLDSCLLGMYGWFWVARPLSLQALSPPRLLFLLWWAAESMLGSSADSCVPCTNCVTTMSLIDEASGVCVTSICFHWLAWYTVFLDGHERQKVKEGDQNECIMWFLPIFIRI